VLQITKNESTKLQIKEIAFGKCPALPLNRHQLHGNFSLLAAKIII
jgi:hypothetical protein